MSTNNPNTDNKNLRQENPSSERKGKVWAKIKKKSKDLLNNPLSKIIINIVALLSFIFTVWSLYAALTKREVEIEEIRLGIAPFQMNEISDLEDNQLLLLKNTNIFLRDQKSGFRISPYISNSGGYEGVLDDLKNNKIQMAFVTQCLYTSLIHNKICKFAWDTTYHRELNKSFELIGFKKIDNNSVYNSGIIYNLYDSNSFYKIVKKGSWDDSLIKVIKEFSIILNSDEYSTSSHAVPEMFLLEKGINLKSNIKHELLNRYKMKEKVLNAPHTIGFISDGDYDRIEPNEKGKLGFIKIDIPIPYDAILVNYHWWNCRLDGKQRDLFKRALNTMPLGFIDCECVRNKYDVFHNYLFSGVVYRVNNNVGYVQFPDKQFDIFNFDTIHSNTNVMLVRFKNGNISSKSLFSFEQKEVDTATLYYEKGEHIIRNKANLEQGIHVLLKIKTNNKNSKKNHKKCFIEKWFSQ